MTSGRSDELKARVKEAAGAPSGNEKLKREGKTDQVVAKIKQKVEKAARRKSPWVRGLRSRPREKEKEPCRRGHQ